MIDHIQALSLRQVKVTDSFWSARQQLITDVTVPYMEKILRDEVDGAEKSHAIHNFKMAAGDIQGEFYGMVFQDSDVYKWLEAVAYSLAVKPDQALETRADEMIDLIARAQQPDGYLNTYFIIQEPENRWKNLLECHELYCAGHLFEAAAAYYEETGKGKLLSVAERFASHIIDRFGVDGEVGVPGHQEVEIGLMRLYHTTGKQAYCDMAKRFLDVRGQDPDYFIVHTPPHPGRLYSGYDINPDDTNYNQSFAPVRDQKEARGHAVRCAYMLTAMADVAGVTDDHELKAACERLWSNITEKQMYLTGAIGSTGHRESFTVDFDLPNDMAYGETCASVAMAFFAQRMLNIQPKGQYADVLELELYNGMLAGMQLDGQRYFYVNPLEVDPAVSGVIPGHEHVLCERPKWHACACCPPNLARLITSLGKYLWSESEDTIYSHLFVGSEAQTAHAGITLSSEYPWQGKALYTLHPHVDTAFSLAVHIPSYVPKFVAKINGECIDGALRDGYLFISREWQDGDQVEITFDLKPRRIYANPQVRADAGRVALARGPIVYCFEGVDNGQPLSALRLPRTAQIEEVPYDAQFLGGAVSLTAQGLREQWAEALYSSVPSIEEEQKLQAIPYYAWSNRGENQMCVWIRE
ncbi:MAG: glycoside hydrolase family 127 protein [Clostridiales bacterium]|nr:glycoside hydrolase family 127 protein [Clostridiales bacterium]